MIVIILFDEIYCSRLVSGRCGRMVGVGGADCIHSVDYFEFMAAKIFYGAGERK